MDWNDPRVSWNKAIYGLFPGLMNWDLDDLYVPKYFWPNRIENRLSKLAQKSLKSDGLGNIKYIQEFRGVFSCPMSLESYPLDVQDCAVIITTRVPVQDIRFVGGAISCGPSSSGDYFMKYGNQSVVESYGNTGKDGEGRAYSAARFDIYFKHSPSIFQNMVIIPCIMLFVIGYSSMYLTAQPARAAFCIISFLTVSGIDKVARDMIPVHVGTLWVDQFLLMHHSFAFIMVIENVLSCHPLMQLEDRKVKEAKREKKKAKELEDTEMQGISMGDVHHGLKLSADDRQILNNLFRRYDLDKSDTINSRDEFAQLTTNLVWKLRLSVPLAQLEQLVAAIDDPAADPLTEQMFSEWFEEYVLPVVVVPPPPSAFQEDVEDKIPKKNPIYSWAWWGEGPTMVGKNKMDIVGHRLIPLVYILCLTVMLIQMEAHKMEYPDAAFEPPANCASETSLEYWDIANGQ